MPTDLIEALGALAAEWDDAAPAITLGDLERARTISDEAPPTSPEVAVVGSTRRPRRWLIAVSVAAALALVVVAVATIGGDDPDRRIEPPVGSDVVSPPSTTAVATTSPIPLAEQLVEIQRESLDALARLESVSATVNYEVDDRSGTPLNASGQRVTVMADGRTWSEGDPELWSSYDPSTGVTRSAGLMDDGTISYGEVTGLAVFTGQTNAFFGSFLVAPVIPWPTLTDNAGYVTVSEIDSHLGRPAWRIEMTGPLVDDDRSLEAWVIDRETGLVVEYRSHPGPVPGAMNTHTVLDDVVTNAELPPAFPGTFPDGATVSRQTTTEGFHLATVANAAREFGSPIAVPAGLPDDAIVQVISQPDIDHPDATFFEVTAETHEGFNRVRVTTRKHVLAPGAPVPDGFTLQDGLLCDRFRTDGRCVGYETPNAIATGAFAGLPMATADSTVEITNGGVWFEVLAPDRERATATAASMRLVSP